MTDHPINNIVENHVHSIIDQLRTRLLFMAAKTQNAFNATVLSLETLDNAIAQSVIDGDAEIDELEVEIDASALSILARTQPVASDLRLIVSSIRLVVDLERIGDEATNIATRVQLLQEQAGIILPEDLLLLAKKTQYMLEEGIESFKDKNTDLAITIRIHQDELTQLVVKNFNLIINALQDKSLDPWLGMHYMLITRCLERIAGRAVNIAEHAYFLTEGVNIKHRAIEKE